MGDDASRTKGLSRRGLVAIVAVAAIALGLGAVASFSRGWWRVDRVVDAKPAGAGVRAYFGNLRDGTAIERWTLVHVYDVQLGAIPVVMATQDGKRFQVDLLRRDPNGPTGVAETETVSLFISNAGGGGLSTPEEEGQGILALAVALKQRESDGAKPPALSTMNERTAASAMRRADGPAH